MIEIPNAVVFIDPCTLIMHSYEVWLIDRVYNLVLIRWMLFVFVSKTNDTQYLCDVYCFMQICFVNLEFYKEMGYTSKWLLLSLPVVFVVLCCPDGRHTSLVCSSSDRNLSLILLNCYWHKFLSWFIILASG